MSLHITPGDPQSCASNTIPTHLHSPPSPPTTTTTITTTTTLLPQPLTLTRHAPATASEAATLHCWARCNGQRLPFCHMPVPFQTSIHPCFVDPRFPLLCIGSRHARASSPRASPLPYQSPAPVHHMALFFPMSIAIPTIAKPLPSPLQRHGQMLHLLPRPAPSAQGGLPLMRPRELTIVSLLVR